MLVLPRSLFVLIASGLLLIEQQPSRNSEMPQINPQERSPKKEPATSSETSAPSTRNAPHLRAAGLEHIGGWGKVRKNRRPRCCNSRLRPTAERSTCAKDG